MNHEIQGFDILGKIGQKLQGFSYQLDRTEPPPTSQKLANSPPQKKKFCCQQTLTQKVLSPHYITISMLKLNKNFILSCDHTCHTILIDDQYIQNVVLSLEKSSDGQTHSSSDSYYPTKKIPSKISHSPQLGESPYPLMQTALKFPTWLKKG